MTDTAATETTTGGARDLKALRAPFPAGTVGKLPQPLSTGDKDKGKCQKGWNNREGYAISADGYFCGGYHARSIHIDFVGHAAVTDRLLEVDPEWNWEPLALDPMGFPALDRDGNLWIRLTVCGVTRLGCGDGPTMKIRIGDAIRNAAMRYGVALSLWSRNELESGAAEVMPSQAQPAATEPPAGQPSQPEAPAVNVTPEEVGEYALAKEAAWAATARHGNGNAERLAVLDDVLKSRNVNHTTAGAADFMAAARELNTGEISEPLPPPSTPPPPRA